MRKFFSFIIAVVFSLWLLPLAPFVAPSEDAKICEGRRAICLCRHKPSADSLQPSALESFQAGQAQMQKDASGGCSPRFLLAQLPVFEAQSSGVLLFSSEKLVYSFRFIPVVDQVPRVA